MIAEAEQIELQRLALNHPLGWNVGYAYLSKVRLSGDGTQRRELRTVEPHPVVVVLVFVLKSLQNLWSIVAPVLGLGTQCM